MAGRGGVATETGTAGGATGAGRNSSVDDEDGAAALVAVMSSCEQNIIRNCNGIKLTYFISNLDLTDTNINLKVPHIQPDFLP
jgi:hypothetical protein